MHSESSDEELMVRYRDEGDANAFEMLYRRHKGALYRYLLRQCSQRGPADELFQDIWMKLIQARARYQTKSNFKTYLFSIAHNRVIDHYRQQGKIPRSQGSERTEDPDELPIDARNQPERHTDTRQQVNRLMRLIDALPQAQREAFLLREEAGLGIAEIARVTGVTREAAKSRLRYALSRLRRGLRETL